MKHLNILNLSCILSLVIVSSASAYWWLPPTICKKDTSQCYTATNGGIATEFWDTDAKCWGMKYICPDAITYYVREPKTFTKKELTDKSKFDPDYDLNLYSVSDDCFGIRRINKEGNQAYVDGKYVNIWCNGILDKPDESFTNGEITYGEQPTCETLKKIGYAAVNTGTCFGKYYDESQYYIECGTALLPTRLIVLNNAYYGLHKESFPVTQTDADIIFDEMYKNSQTQKSNI